MISTAARKGADVVCLPELFDSLYFPQEERSQVKPRSIPNATTKALSDAAKNNGVVVIGGSLYEKSLSASYNTATVFDSDGKMVGRYRKVHIPQDPGFYEQDYFDRGTATSLRHDVRQDWRPHLLRPVVSRACPDQQADGRCRLCSTPRQSER